SPARHRGVSMIYLAGRVGWASQASMIPARIEPVSWEILAAGRWIVEVEHESTADCYDAVGGDGRGPDGIRRGPGAAAALPVHRSRRRHHRRVAGPWPGDGTPACP